jgi:3-oxoacyl-[acyl-carrier-protein] synthase II
MIAVQGIGWLDATAYGRIRQRVSIPYAERMTLRELGKSEGLFKYPVKNFGRFEPQTQRVCCITSLALQDAGIDYAEGRRLDIGLLGTNGTGCLESNLNYFKDYVDGGRTLSRANLFIYTLPSSPLAEAAVHFGLQGPQLYMRTAKEAMTPLVRRAAGMIRRGEAGNMLVYRLGSRAGLCMVIGETEQAICSLEQAIEIDENAKDGMTRIENFKKAAEQNEN